MLRDILQYAAEATGIREVNDQTRAQLLRYINRAGRELYEKYDLPGTVLEITACVDADDGQITLPWYVDQIRAVRRSELHRPIEVHDIRPRYHETPWRQNLLEWRVKRRVALHTPLSAESQLTLTLAEAQAETIQFAVAGQTSDAGQKEEVLTLDVGETSVTTTTQWAREQPFGIERITKSVITTCDVIVTQASNGAEVAVIPNRLNAAQSVLVQVNDLPAGSQAEDYCVDVLFKRPYVELYYDDDVFGDGKLEDALVWKLRAHYNSLSSDPAVFGLAPTLSASAEDLVRGIVRNQEKEAVKEFSTARPSGERAWRYGYRNRQRYYR